MSFLSKFRRKVNVAVMEADKELYWDSLPRLIAPASIVEYPTYILINNELMARCIAVGIPPVSDLGGYPSDLNPKVVDNLMQLSNKGYKIAYSFTVIPIPNQTSMKMLDLAIYNNKVSQESFRDKKGNDKNKQPPLKKIFEEEDFAQNYKELYKNSQKMFHTAFIIIFFGKTNTELRAAESHVRVVLESNRIYYEAPDFKQLETFVSAMPFPFSLPETWCELFSYHTSALLGTRNVNSRSDDCGLLFGQDLKTEKDVMINLKTLSSGHMLIVGPTGSGKTFTSMILAMRNLTMLQRRIIYITPKGDAGTDFRAVCEYFNGSVIDIGVGDKNINPLQILYDSQSHGDMVRVFDDHFELLTQFFEVLFEGLSSNMTSYISESLMETYKRKGIVRQFPETWEKCTNWPTLLDLREIWLEDSQNPKEVTAKALADKSFLFTTSWSFLNRPTNIDISNNFLVCDLSAVPESLKSALNVFVTGLMGLRFRTDNKKGTILMVDEGAQFLRNERLSTFLLKALTTGRSFGVSLYLMTQQPSDLQKVNLSEEFRTNMPLSIILGNMRSDTVDIVKDFFKLDENATTDLLSAGVGEGLLLVGEEVIPIKFKPSTLEEEIIKGKLNKKIASVHDGIKLIHDGLLNLVTEHGLIMQDWIEGDDASLVQLGYEPRRVQRAIGSGLIRAWIKTDILNGEMVMNQSIDHYSTILQIAGWLQQHGIMADIQHLDGPDIAFKISEQQYYVEFEHGEQSPQILQQKKQDTSNGRLIFVGTSSNIKYLYNAVGEENVVKRGQQLANFLDELIDGNPDKNTD